MSDKRRRQQQRRARRRSASAARSTVSGSGRGGSDRELAELLGELAQIAARGAHEPQDALEAEQWASGLLGTFRSGPLPDPGVDEVFVPGIVRALERIGGKGALATLRAFAAVVSQPNAPRASAAANRLAAAGVAEPPWAGDLGATRPLAVQLMHEPAFDDGVTVLVEFSGPGAETHTLGVYIDHNMGGLVKDAFVVGPLDELHEQLARAASATVNVSMRDVDPGEARARVERALEQLDHTYDPPVAEDVRMLRALVERRVSLLPAGAVLPDDWPEVSDEECERLWDAFFDGPEGRRWSEHDGACDAVAMALDFGSGYNHGGPLRWSPVVVEIFMTSWLPRKIVRERAFFEFLPDVLRDWLAFAGRCRGVPVHLVDEAAGAVSLYRDEMLDSVSDPQTWGPAKVLAMAAEQAGVDLSDPEALEEFVERFNQGLAA